MSQPQESDVVLLTKNEKTSCKIHLFGGTLISWICDGDELIFLSSKAKFDNKAAIRGGVPIVFPNFGPWSFGPQHGFARISRWSLEQSPKEDGSGNVTAVLSLEDTEETRAMWSNHRFKLTLTVVLSSNSLSMTFAVLNRGDTTMNFTCLLHTYFRVSDIAKATVSDVKGLSYVDKALDGKTFTEDRDLLQFNGFVDRAYQNTPDEQKISGLMSGKVVVMKKANLPDTVVWNPWKEKASQMSDMGEGEYVNMLCVEAGHVSDAVQLEANKTFVASQTLSII